MTSIESIKQKILQLDAGSFQNFCDAYLSRIGYPNIVSLGAEAGTKKTTKGTPDTYFYTSEGKYVFVEYTTQKSNLIKKINKDIAKCLDISKTGITYNKISEIIYCHTSSNITPAQDNKIKDICENVGIKFTIIGIDKIAEDIYLFYHGIARDFLGVSLNTNQIQEHDDFVKEYNANKMAAPIDTEFLFRDKEIISINDAYQKSDIVILNGPPGAGKTRLALQYAKNHSNENNEKLYCIHNNALPLYEDLKLLIGDPGNYFIFVDDANQLSGLQHIIHYAMMKDQGYNVKILITVRDYAIQKVKNDIREFVPYELVNISIFTDDEINKMLKVLLRISNSNYLERIVKIAEGNARIAILAGKVACDSNRLDSINDVSLLYEDYYSNSLRERDFFINDSLQITAGILAFLGVIHIDRLDSLLPILESKGLTRHKFIENIRKLHELEIVDISYDKAVRFSEQCLSNYILKYVYYDKKLLSLSTTIKGFFYSNKERVIYSVNTLLNVFRYEELFHFVEQEIKTLWEELSQENSPYFFEFVKVFSRVNTIETLLILQDKINREDNVIIEGSTIDTKKGKNYQSITDEIIEILGGFADMDDLPAALDLFFQYYIKRPDLYIEFYHAVNLYFGIQRHSTDYGYTTQIKFFRKLKEYSDEWKQESIVILFYEVAKEFLKLFFHPSESGRKNNIVMYNIPLIMSEGVEKYRGLIWEYLNEISKIDKYKNNIIEILNSYGGEIEDISIAVAQFDLPYIRSIVEVAFSPFELNNCLLADSLTQVFTRIGIIEESLFEEYFKEESFCLYRLLKGPEYTKKIAFEELRKIKENSIRQYVANCDEKAFKRLIDVCSGVNDLDGHLSWRIGEGLGIAFNAISLKKDCYIGAIRYYLKNNTPNNLYPSSFVKTLFSLLPDGEVYHLINSYEYAQKNAWLYAYYHELPQELITEKQLQALYDFLSDSSDAAITSSPYRDVDFLEKYRIIDEKVYVNGCKIILEKMKYSPFMVNIYFYLMFNHVHNEPKILIQRFTYDLSLLEEIYTIMLTSDKHHDYDGRFLREIYIVSPSLLDNYIDYLDKDKYALSDYNERNHCFFDLDNFKEIYDKILERLILGCQFPTMSVPYFLESILLPRDNEPDLLQKQNEWIHHCIELFANDTTKMYCLFSTTSKLSISRKTEYVKQFLKYNQDSEAFEKLPLTPNSWSWSGSVVPMYSGWINYLESLLPNLIGLKWIKHKKHIQEQIYYFKRQIESEEIDEILRG